ncbi:MAG: autotransporter domain-containing protein [Bosea sp.]|uniref:autotransporter domain-containing protein n=1 Tax=Bosea sp. (in: a-proteobacteria) TaxID=1871050 RepID=UPI002398C67C|nr:autotransporter domain-containing protein [Bosea sp. (in: a-proteobacteria)]MCP4735478.1 autotransporter domain-containing protein [Bosea sp. (in: a-proteobacteria)]
MSSAVSLRALMLAAGLTLLAGAPAALAQSVSGSGDIAPVLPTPRPSWTPTLGLLFVGDSGTGTLTIENGGSVSTSETSVGWRTGGIGTVTVTGAGSAWTNSGLLYVGYEGTGTLAIENGGTVTSGSLTYIGRSSGSTGSVTVTGAGSTWTNNDTLAVGSSGTGTLIIEDGGTVSNARGFVGWQTGGTGTVTVTGAGSTWTNTDLLGVGYFGTGTLIIENGGTVSNTDAFVGDKAGSTGSVTVTGGGSTWTNSRQLHVGYEGTGTLTIADGGKVSNTVGYVGVGAGSTSTVTVTGLGSTWTNSAELYVGGSGTGTLTIAGGGKVSSTVGYVGHASGSTGTVTVTGAGSTWTNNGTLNVGYGGTGTLTIADGGVVTSAGAGGPAGSIGVTAGSTGTVTVTGAGSTWLNNGMLGDGELYVGKAGTGTLIVEDGGWVKSTSGYLGFASGGSGTVTVTGTGSRWTVVGLLDVGRDGTGTLTIANGGAIESGGTEIGRYGAGTGSVTVTGAGSALYTRGITIGGTSGAGTLTIEKEGYVQGTGVVFYGSGGTLNLLGDATNGRGVLEANYVWANYGTVNLDGGILRARMNSSWFFDSVGVQTIGANGAFFDSNGYEIVVSASFDGTGGLTKLGAGTLTLTGTSSYTGGTSILGGTLSISSDANLGDASGGLTFDGGSLQVTGSFASSRAVTLGSAGGGIDVVSGQSFSHSGTISGTGGLTKSGDGKLTLTGTSTYSGATTVSAGTLYINGSGAMSAASDYTVAGGALLHVNDALSTVTAGSIAGDGQIRIDRNSTLETGATNASTTFSGQISGDGSLRKVGTGTLTLTRGSTYSGGTTIAGGTISISKGDRLGDASGALTLDGGVLQVTDTILHELTRDIVLGANGGGFDIVEAGNTFTVRQSFSGTGSLSKAGAGTLVLTNTHSYSGATTVSGGTLRAGQAGSFSPNSAFTVGAGATLDLASFSQSIGSLAGAGSVVLGSGNLTTGSDNSSTTFSGSITGTGGVTKTGTGTLTLSGTNTYTGATKVSGGKLVVNGSITSSVTLDGGTLGGSGTVGGVSVGSGATVAPGNSIGTLTVSGNVAFASGSTYQVEVNAAGQSDRIVASGSATLSGGTVQVLAENGNYAASTSYTILTASGGVSGTFSTVTSNLAFLTPSLSYGGTSVTLTMTRNDTSFGPDNGGSGGNTSPSTGGTYIAATRNQGFIAIAAERLGVGNPVYDALISATAAEARAGFDLLSGEAHAQAVSVMIDESRLVRDTILGHLRGPLLTVPGQQVAASFTADLPGRKGAIMMPAPVLQPRYAVWGTAFGSTGNSDGDGNAAGLNRRSGGALLGADVMLYDAPGSSLKVGVAGGYSQSRFDLDARLSTGRLESGHAALYAGARFGNLRFDAGAAYSWSESDIRRQVQIRGFGDLLRLQRPGSVTQGFAELGYAFAFSGVALEPFAQLALIRVSTDAGTERGGAAALRVLSSEQMLGFTTLGLRAEAQLGAMPLFARAMLGWRHGFGELTPQARTAFVAGTTPATVFAARIDREALVAEAGLDWRLSQATALGLTYSAAIGERSRDHALKGRVEMRF